MKINLRHIPDEGLHVEGETPAEEVLALPSSEPVRALGPVCYALDVGKNADGLWATGEASVDLELQCVRCLENFAYPLRVDDIAWQTELPAGETVDLTPLLREDILLTLPAYPHCDWAGDKVCPNHPQSASLPIESAPVGNATAWNALDQLELPRPARKKKA